MGIPVSFGRSLTVVTADRFPGVSVFLHASGQDLCPPPDVAAGITKCTPPFFPEREVPAGIDLHDPEIVGAVFVAVDSPRLEVGLPPGYGPKDLRINAVFLPGLVKAELLGMCFCRHHEQHTDAKDPDLRHEYASRNALETQRSHFFYFIILRQSLSRFKRKLPLNEKPTCFGGLLFLSSFIIYLFKVCSGSLLPPDRCFIHL